LIFSEIYLKFSSESNLSSKEIFLMSILTPVSTTP